MSITKTFFKDTAIYGVGNALQKFIAIFLLPLYTRLLSPEDYGVLSTLSTFTYFISTLLLFGVYYSGQNRYFFQAKDKTEQGSIFFTVLVLTLLSGAVILIGIPFSRPIAEALFSDEKWWLLVLVSLIAIPVNSISSLQDSIYRLFRAANKYVVVTVLRAFLNPLFGVIFVYSLGLGALGVNLASIFSAVILLIFSLWFFTYDKYSIRFSKEFAKKILLFGLPLIPASIAQWALSLSDRFFLLHYSTLAEIGFYSIAMTYAQPVLFIGTAIEMSSGVLLLQTYENEEDPEKPITKGMIVRFWYIYLFLSVTVASIISIFAIEIITFVSTTKYQNSAIGVPFAAFSYILMAGAAHLGMGMVLRERTAPISYMIVIAAAVNILINFYFVPNFGYVGAAVTTLISYSVYFILSYKMSNQLFFVDSKIVRVVTYLFTSFMMALFPVYSVKFLGYDLSWYYKILIVLFLPIIPLVLGLITKKELIFLKEKIFEKILHA